MSVARAIIGAGYGDEGKGVTVDATAARAPGIVVRSNGGAQAGHTVLSPTGERHVFHHIGAGAFAGAATHLSQFFAVHPMFFLDEREAVIAKGGRVDVSVDPRAPVTTPYDIIINQAIEAARGAARHGSCGFGFGETLERNLRPEFALTYGDLVCNDVRGKLDAIRTRWVFERLAKLGIDPQPFAGLLADQRIVDHYLDDCAAMLDLIRILPDRKLAAMGPLVFEAAQGLMLDQDYGAFPHVTRSNTGLRNMVVIASEAGIDRIDVTYATRSYVTRHGAGPLAHAEDDLVGFVIDDPTNEPNAWQGAIRHAPLDVDILKAAIEHDLSTVATTGVAIQPSLVMTCVDQAPDMVPFYAYGKLRATPRAALPSRIAALTGLPLAGTGHGPGRTAQTIFETKKAA